MIAAGNAPAADYAGRVILVVDHRDSFTYNLVQLIERLGHPTEVVATDAEPAEALAARRPDAVVLSPGPGSPAGAAVFLDLLAALPADTPVLGVCLGHQALGVAAGAPVVRGEPVHGHASPVFHDGRGIFEGIPVPFDAARYHSLRVRREDLPPEIEVTAWTEDDVVMGLARRDRPWFGVQFHPESILTPEGPRIVGNFLALA